MAENEYFKAALSSFTFDAACGDSIRHLCDLGYSAQQIQKELAFSVSVEKIENIMEQHRNNKSEDAGGQYEFVKEYDEFGRPSYRRVLIKK